MSFITCKLYGRMGNQMFQIAATMGAAHRFGVEFLIPRYTGDKGKHAEELYFNHFPEFNPDIHKIGQVLHEKGHDHQRFNYYNNMQLDGYFQSERYFSHVKEEVIRWFEMKFGPYEMKAGYVGIHVRRGDYVGNINFPTTPMSFYEEAMAKFPDHKFLIASDDIPYCKKHFTGCEFSSGNHYQDMRLLANCEHVITGNSTFGWWGAMLNRNPNIQVVAPFHRLWFGKKVTLNTRDKVPKNWTTLRYPL